MRNTPFLLVAVPIFALAGAACEPAEEEQEPAAEEAATTEADVEAIHALLRSTRDPGTRFSTSFRSARLHLGQHRSWRSTSHDFGAQLLGVISTCTCLRYVIFHVLTARH